MPKDMSTRDYPARVTAPDAPLGLWGSYRAARRNVLELIPAGAFHQKMIVDEKRGRWIMVVDPEAVQQVMRDREPNYPKSAILIRLMTPREGDNLIVTEGETWQRQRRALSAPFRPRAMEVAGPLITDAARACLDQFDRATDTVDVLPLMARASCDVMCDLALSGRDTIDRDSLRTAVDHYVAGLGRVSLLDILGLPNWVPRPAALFENSRKTMDDLADTIIASRRVRGPQGRADLLDLLISAEQEGALDPLEVRNNLLGFLFAGYETTALSLTWALYLLAFDPAVQRRVQAEVAHVCGDRVPTMEDAPKLDLTRRVIEETLRLYPPAGFLTRTARADDTLAGHSVRAGATVILPIYALHRHHQIWENPDRFDPDRFLPDAVEQRPKGSFVPFGDGPRVCIGASLAMLEATMLLAALVGRFQFDLPPGFTPKPTMWFTLRPLGGMPLRVSKHGS